MVIDRPNYIVDIKISNIDNRHHRRQIAYVFPTRARLSEKTVIPTIFIAKCRPQIGHTDVLYRLQRTVGLRPTETIAIQITDRGDDNSRNPSALGRIIKYARARAD